MQIESTTHSSSTIIDLAGLPAPVVEQVKKLIQEARQADAAQVKPTPQFISRPRPTLEESKRLLDLMATMGNGKVLPADFSRADIYDDHD